MAPFSVSEFSLPSLLLSLWRSATFCATITPLALYQGPLPMRSLAFTAAWPPAADGAQIGAPRAVPGTGAAWPASDSARRRRRDRRGCAPLPDPALVMKKPSGWACVFTVADVPVSPRPITATPRSIRRIAVLLVPRGRSSDPACAGTRSLPGRRPGASRPRSGWPRPRDRSRNHTATSRDVTKIRPNCHVKCLSDIARFGPDGRDPCRVEFQPMQRFALAALAAAVLAGVAVVQTTPAAPGRPRPRRPPPAVAAPAAAHAGHPARARQRRGAAGAGVRCPGAHRHGEDLLRDVPQRARQGRRSVAGELRRGHAARRRRPSPRR